MDQTNLQERSDQVQLMWAIYAQASKTLACLGDDSSDSGIAMGLIAADYKNLSSTHESRPSVGPKSGGPISSRQTAIGNCSGVHGSKACGCCKRLTLHQISKSCAVTDHLIPVR